MKNNNKKWITIYHGLITFFTGLFVGIGTVITAILIKYVSLLSAFIFFLFIYLLGLSVIYFTFRGFIKDE